MDSIRDLLSFILLLPITGFFIALFFGKYLKLFIGYICSFCILVSFIISLFLFSSFQFNLTKEPYVIITFFKWLNLYDLSFNFSYQIDQISLYMLLIITGIGSLIHFYSIGYMKGEENFERFFAYLNLFIFSMLNLVLADNLVLMFFGWEGVGLCSYLLIGFDYHKKTAIDAGNKAFITNRIGDLGILIGIILLFSLTNTVQYVDLIEQFSVDSSLKKITNIVAICFFIGTLAKSAQFPLYIWLPDAMAGPTPVSALIHAATMVTAGIYLIVRLNFIFFTAVELNFLIACIGAFTAFFSATIATKQNDIKKILAYSTISQLGFMFLALGIGAYVAALFHLMTHAFFKALLFLCAGSVIHAMQGEQDIKKMGGLKNYMKITYVTFFIGTLAISGFPFFSGFFSKDLILEKTFSYSPFLWSIASITALLTSFYMFRLFFLVFWGKERMEYQVQEKIHESPFIMTLPLMILGLGSVFSGFLQVPHIFTNQLHILTSYFQPLFEPSKMIAKNFNQLILSNSVSSSTEIILVIGSVCLSFIGLSAAYLLYVKREELDSEPRGFWKILYHKYYVDEFLSNYFIFPLKSLSDFLYRKVDVYIVDGIFVNLSHMIAFLGNFFRRLQSGFIGDYVIMTCIGFLLLLSILFLKGL